MDSLQKIFKASCLGLDVKIDTKKFGGDLNKARAMLDSAIAQAFRGPVGGASNTASAVGTAPVTEPGKQ
jgi:hypothetical protein